MFYKITMVLTSGMLSFVAFPLLAGAQQEWASYTSDTLSILDVYIFWSTIVLALVAIGMVFSNAAKMKGGAFATVLNLFGSGMVVTFLGYLTMLFPALLPAFFGGLLSDILFIVGYVLMAIAASRLARAIGG